MIKKNARRKAEDKYHKTKIKFCKEVGSSDLFNFLVQTLDITIPLWYNTVVIRGVAQFGSALGSGPRGRKFESCHSDQNRKSAGENRRIFDFVFFFFHYSIFIIH